MKFKFKPSLASDVWNWQEVATHTGSYGQNWRANWPKDITLKDAQDKEKMRAYLQKKYYRKGAVKLYTDWLQVVVKPQIVGDILYKVTGKEVPFKEVLVIPTTNGRCPYDPSDGMLFIHYGSSPSWIYQTAAHECMHFIVHKNYWKKMRSANLSEEQAHDIKEALTVLLNPELKRRWGKQESGYPAHQNLRKDIEKIAKKSKDFDEIIGKTIKLYQKKYYTKVS